MKILVTVKRVIDYNVKIRVASDGSGVELGGVKMSMNPFDEIALEEAIRIKERGEAERIDVVTLSRGDEAQDILRSSLALGADSALLVKTEYLEPLAVARVIKRVVEIEGEGGRGYDMIIMGKQAIDDDANQTGQLLSSLLNYPLLPYISRLGVCEDGIIEADCEVDRGIERIRASLPLVVTVDLRLNEPRYPSLPGIMKAKRKPLRVVSSEDLGVEGMSDKIEVLEVKEPVIEKSPLCVGSVGQLLDKLRNEAKVI